MNARCLTLMSRAGVTMALLAAPSSCSESNSAPPHAPDAATAEARMGDAPSDRDQLLACDVPEPCPSGLARLADQKPFTITPERMPCILEGLEERKAGRYVHETRQTWANGSAGSQHVLITHADGTAHYAPTKYVDLMSVDPEAMEQATRLCTLRDPNYFSACVDAVLAVRPREPSAGRAWDCSYGEGPEQPSELDWFESCEAASAADACE